MRCLPLVIGAVAAFAFNSGASAQSINLTGTYRCVQDCRDGYVGAPAFVTQNGEHLNLVTEAGDFLPGVARCDGANQPDLDRRAQRGRGLFARWNANSV